MDVIDGMKCDDVVPDDIYLSATINARTPEEIVFRDVLIFHRDVLNGGLDQALSNQAEDPAKLLSFTHAYERAGMVELASLIADAHAEFATSPEVVTAKFDELAERYTELTYGDDHNEVDAVEAKIIRFAQSRSAAFADIAAGAATAAKDTGADELLKRMEDVLRRIREGS